MDKFITMIWKIYKKRLYIFVYIYINTHKQDQRNQFSTNNKSKGDLIYNVEFSY